MKETLLDKGILEKLTRERPTLSLGVYKDPKGMIAMPVIDHHV
jgi:hypothetical protein